MTSGSHFPDMSIFDMLFWSLNRPFRAFSLPRLDRRCRKAARGGLQRSGRHLGAIFLTLQIVACLLRINLLMRNLGADSVISWPRNRDPQARKRPFLGRIFCSLERRGWMTLGGAAAPPNPPARKRFLDFWLKKVQPLGSISA